MKLKELRAKKDYSQQDLADKLKKHVNTIQKWEYGKTQIPDKQLVKLAEIFNIEMSEIIKLKYYDFNKPAPNQVNEESTIYRKINNKYTDLDDIGLKAVLNTYKNTLTKINQRITELENNGNDVKYINELLEYNELRTKTLQLIAEIENIM